MRRPHGSPLRGLQSHPSSPAFEGTFGRLFRSLPAAEFSNTALEKLAEKMLAPKDPETPEDQIDDEENPGIDAGYTYFGQFIDHDLTFDPASSLQKQDDPNGLVDYRTPRFDLDNLYGRGPDDQPYMYEPRRHSFDCRARFLAEIITIPKRRACRVIIVTQKELSSAIQGMTKM